MHEGTAIPDQRRNRLDIVECPVDDVHTQRIQRRGALSGPGQGSHGDIARPELGAEMLADKSGRAGDRDPVACRDQAEATLRRTSSATALSRSWSWASMKSSLAFERDNLPEEVRGSE